MTHAPYPVPPGDAGSDDVGAVRNYARRVADVLRGVMAGHLNVLADLTLTANAATTTFVDPRLSVQSVLLLMPKTANAAAALATTYATGRTSGQATINHANNAQTDREFAVVIIG